MFTDMFEMWREDRSKTIVNINSRTKYIPGTDNYYYNSKIQLADETNKHIFDRKCRIININPGYVMTDFAKHFIDEDNAPFMTAEQVAEYVKWAIDQPFEIYELSLWNLDP
jgi:NADP-dependent 3-hydroxy acid dehydrogenase YdfG